ncbi:MAG: hypothetical protein ACFE9L_15025 [Candidatus Hodarchaeota archaeon]
MMYIGKWGPYEIKGIQDPQTEYLVLVTEVSINGKTVYCYREEKRSQVLLKQTLLDDFMRSQKEMGVLNPRKEVYR